MYCQVNTQTAVNMNKTISNRTPEGTHDREVMGGLTVTGEAFGRLLFVEGGIRTPLDSMVSQVFRDPLHR